MLSKNMPSHAHSSHAWPSHAHYSHSHSSSPAPPEHSTTSAKEGRRRWSSSGRGISRFRLLPLLLSVLPAPAPLFCLLLHLVDPLEQPLGPDHLRAAEPHHIVAGVFPSLLAGSAEVVVIADDALVSVSNDGGLVASIAGDTMMDHIGSHSRFLGLLDPLGAAHSCSQLVHGACQLGQGQDQPLVRVDGDSISIFVRPGNGEEFFGKDGENRDELLLDVDEAGADLPVHYKPPHLGLLPL